LALVRREERGERLFVSAADGSDERPIVAVHCHVLRSGREKVPVIWCGGW